MNDSYPAWADAQRNRLHRELDNCRRVQRLAGWLLGCAALTVFWFGVFWWVLA